MNDLKETAESYRESAKLLKERMEKLRGNPENADRVMLLQAEYYYLLRAAEYLEHYYDNEAT